MFNKEDWHINTIKLYKCVTWGLSDGQGGLACCNSWGRKDSDTTEPLNWTELRAKWRHGRYYENKVKNSGHRIIFALYLKRPKKNPTTTFLQVASGKGHSRMKTLALGSGSASMLHFASLSLMSPHCVIQPGSGNARKHPCTYTVEHKRLPE